MPITIGMRRLGLGLALLVLALAATPAPASAAGIPGARIQLDKGGTFTAAELSAFPGGHPFPRDTERREHEGSERNVEKPAAKRPNPRSPRAADGGVARDVQPTLSLASPLGFDGPNLNDAPFYPPDTQGDVGPTQFIAMINGRVRSYAKATGVADGALNADTDVFWSSVMTPASPGNFTTDPHIRYDRLSGRWFAVMIDVPGGNGDIENRIMLAVSDSGTITGSTNFHFFSIPEGVANEFADYPTLGIDKNALYIGTNQFKTTGQNPFAGTNVYVVNKASLIAGGTPVATRFRAVATQTAAGPFTPQGVDNDDPGATTGFFIGVDNQNFGQLDLLKVADPGGTPTLSTQTLTVPATAVPLAAANLGGVPIPGGTKLDDLDDRLYAAQMQNGHIFTAHNIGVNASGVAATPPSRDGSRWYEINPGATPTLVQSGTVFDNSTSDPLSYWIPTVAVSKQGVLAIGGSVAGATHMANAWYAGRAPGEATGTVGGLTEYTSSSASYSPPFPRWGDYSLTRVDPDDGMTLWTIQEYVAANDVWGTRVAKLRAPAPPAPTGSSQVGVGAPSTSVTVTGTPTNGVGYFDPGPGFPDRLSAAIGGCGVTVNGVLDVAPGAVTLDLNTTGATIGDTCDVTISNPDGQSATTNSLFTVSGDHVPVANPDGPFTLTCCAPFSGPSVLANDTDADGDPLTAIKVSDPAHGTVALAAGGTFTYTPATGFSGSDSFTYAASDGQVQSGPETVSLSVAPASGGGGTNTGGGTTTTPTPTTPAQATPPQTTTTTTQTTTAQPGASTTVQPTLLTATLRVFIARLRTVLAKGLRIRTTCNAACSVRAKLTLSRTDAKRLRLKTTVATVRGKGGSVLRLRIPKATAKVLARLKRIRVKVAVTAITTDGRRKTVSKVVTLRR